jgi:hypothetical protein
LAALVCATTNPRTATVAWIAGQSKSKKIVVTIEKAGVDDHPQW